MLIGLACSGYFGKSKNQGKGQQKHSGEQGAPGAASSSASAGRNGQFKGPDVVPAALGARFTPRWSVGRGACGLRRRWRNCP